MHNFLKRINWAHIFIGLVYLATAISILMQSGCTAAQRRTAAQNAETVGIAYGALLTTMAVHEGGHSNDQSSRGYHISTIRIERQFYEPWEIPTRTSIGLTWNIDGKYGKQYLEFDQSTGRTFLHFPENVGEQERQLLKRGLVHGGLAGITMTGAWYRAFDQGLRDGTLDGRFSHALALFLGLDPVIQAYDGYRNYHLIVTRQLSNDLADHLIDMGGGQHGRDMLIQAITADLIGKGPELWWHLRGMAGYDEPPPRWCHIGNMEIGPGMVITEWRFGWGLNGILSF